MNNRKTSNLGHFEAKIKVKYLRYTFDLIDKTDMFRGILKKTTFTDYCAAVTHSEQGHKYWAFFNVHCTFGKKKSPRWTV